MIRFRGLPPILAGPGSVGRLGEFLEGKVLVVTDQGLSDAGILSHLALTNYETHIQPSGEPTAETVDLLADTLCSSACDWVVGIGGGSVLDTVKFAGCVSGDVGNAEYYTRCQNELPISPCRRVLIPTTAGTGSEVTRTSVFTDSEGRKTWAWGEQIGCDLIVLDGEITRTLPHLGTCLSGLDAVAHALESYLSPGCEDFASSFCLQALTLAGEHLPRVAARPSDIDARQGMLLASMLAGVGIDICGTGLAHAASHAAGSVVRSGHAEGVVWAMPVAIEWNQTHAVSGCRAAAARLDPGSESLLQTWSRLVASCGELPRPRGLVGETLKNALLFPENQPMLKNNARPVRHEDIDELVSRLLEDS